MTHAAADRVRHPYRRIVVTGLVGGATLGLLVAVVVMGIGYVIPDPDPRLNSFRPDLAPMLVAFAGAIGAVVGLVSGLVAAAGGLLGGAISRAALERFEPGLVVGSFAGGGATVALLWVGVGAGPDLIGALIATACALVGALVLLRAWRRGTRPTARLD